MNKSLVQESPSSGDLTEETVFSVEVLLSESRVYFAYGCVAAIVWDDSADMLSMCI